MIEILSVAALCTVQDIGRFGALNLGVGTSGAMDPMALSAGNILVGNADDAAGIEIPILPFSARSARDTIIAVTGAGCAITVDGRPLLPWWAHRLRAGQVLTLKHAPPAGWRGARTYLCVAGGIDAPVVLGSRSTQLRGTFGGFEGRPLIAGDVLPVGVATSNADGFGLVPPVFELALAVDGVPAMRVLPAAEYDAYQPQSQEAFWRCAWKVTPQSDRYGYRLAGETLEPRHPLELRSHGIVPGVIQVPHNGQPIIQMRDAQPTGGYPKIGTVIEADLWRLGQAPIGSFIRFKRCSWDEARAAHVANRQWLDDSRRLVALHLAREVAA